MDRVAEMLLYIRQKLQLVTVQTSYAMAMQWRAMIIINDCKGYTGKKEFKVYACNCVCHLIEY